MINKEEVRVVFMGTSSDCSLAALNAIMETGVPIKGIVENLKKTRHVSLYDRYARGKSILKKKAKECDIPFFATDNVNSIESEEWVREKDCTLICVCSAFQLMKENIINIPRLGVVNAHGALLPNYRGANPPYWYFRNMENKGG